MNKKIVLLITIITALSFAGAAHAEELSTGSVVVNDEVSPTAVVLNDSGAEDANNAGAGQAAEPAAVPEGDLLDAANECTETGDCEDLENIEHAGTSGEAEVVCANDEEADCETDAAEEAEEVVDETWPLIVSLSALGATIFIVIILNLFGKRKKS